VNFQVIITYTNAHIEIVPEKFMKTLSNTLEALIERWDDPGDYPSNAGSGPLPSCDYLEGMEGELKIELTPEELTQFNEAVEVGEQQDWVQENIEDKNTFPKEIVSATWIHKIEGNILTLWAEEVEVSDWQPEEPDYDLIRKEITTFL